MPSTPCPFCNPDRTLLFEENDAFAIYDAYPISKGHSLVIPHRHVKSVFDLMRREQEACAHIIGDLKRFLEEEFHPDGFNVGINDGEVAGQTVMHAHIHVIPRYEGDVESPDGGVRHLMPGEGTWR